VTVIVALGLAESLLHAGTEHDSRSIFRPSRVPGLIYDAIPGATTLQGKDSSLSPWPVAIDEHGARRTPAGQLDCADLWIFGDSFAFGWGVDDAQAWPALLAPALAQHRGCEPKVWNWALPGYHLGQMEARLRLLLEQGRPDLVVLHIEELDGIADFDFSNPLGLPAVLRRSSLARPLQVLAVQRFDRSVTDSFVRLEQQNQELVRRVRSIAALLKQEELKTIAVLEPEVHAIVRAAVEKELGTPIDISECSGEGGRFKTDPHYTAQGNRCIAELVAAAIPRRLVPAPPAP
jgi:hypothetical protein